MLLLFFFLFLFLEFLVVFCVADAVHHPSPLLSNTALLVQGSIAGLAGCSAGLDIELPMYLYIKCQHWNVNLIRNWGKIPDWYSVSSIKAKTFKFC